MHLLEYLVTLHKMRAIHNAEWTLTQCGSEAEVQDWHKHEKLLPALSQMEDIGIDVEEYVNLFRTSAVRVALSAYLPPNVD